MYQRKKCLKLTQILPIGRNEMLVATIEEVMGITIFAQTLPTYAKEVLETHRRNFAKQ